MIGDRATKIFLIAAAVAVVGGVALGFFMTGSPAHQRDVEADNRRVQDLATIAQEIYSFVNPAPKPGQTSTVSRALPGSLDELPFAYSTQPHDPMSGASYEYHPASETNYRLCATFATDATEAARCIGNPGMRCPAAPASAYGPRIFSEHPAGNYCFELDASKSPYETVPPPHKVSAPILP